jgi:hypothetical protein
MYKITHNGNVIAEFQKIDFRPNNDSTWADFMRREDELLKRYWARFSVENIIFSEQSEKIMLAAEILNEK